MSSPFLASHNCKVSARMESMNIVQDSSFGVVPVHKTDEGKYLFCVVKHVTGHWAFPKGHKEDGESDIEAARRELFEETGISAIETYPGVSFIESYSFDRDGITYKKTVTYFLGLVSAAITPVHADPNSEISAVEWLSYPKLLARLTFSESVEVATDANEHLYKTFK